MITMIVPESPSSGMGGGGANEILSHRKRVTHPISNRTGHSLNPYYTEGGLKLANSESNMASASAPFVNFY